MSFLIGCSQILQDVDLSFDEKDRVAQEDFTVVEKTLTLSEAKSRQSDPYIRSVIQKGLGNKSRLISENEAIMSDFPKTQPIASYLIGKGDTLVFSKLMDKSENLFHNDLSWPKKEKQQPYVVGITDAISVINFDDNATALPEPYQKEPYKVGVGDILNFSQIIEGSKFKYTETNQWPIDNDEDPYILGIGDQITLVQLNDTNSNLSNFSNGEITESTLKALTKNENNAIQTSGRIGSDGSVLLLEVGRLEAEDKTINDLRLEVRNILIRNGLSPKFQLEISGFNSQKAYLTLNTNLSDNENQSSGGGAILQLTDQPLTLREVLTRFGVYSKPGLITNIRLQRGTNNYFFNLDDLFSAGAKNIKIKNDDHIFVLAGGSNVFTSEVIVGQDGHIILPNLGKLKVVNKDVENIKTEIQKLTKTNGNFWKDFQLEITGFNSQKAFLTINNTSSVDGKQILENNGILQITDQTLTLREVLASSGIAIKPGVATAIHLQRDNLSYEFELNEVFTVNSQDIVIKNKDHIFIDEGVSSQNRIVENDGSIILSNLGRIKVAGKTVGEIEKEIGDLSRRRNNFWTNFRVKVTGFNSQKAFLTLNTNSPKNDTQPSATGSIIKIADQPLTLREILTASAISLKPGITTVIRLQRDNKTYSFDLQKVFSIGAEDIIIRDKDHIFVDEIISNVFQTKVKVGQDGELVLPNLGKIKVAGKSVEELKKEVQKLSKRRDNFWNDFQLEVTEFGSQQAIVSIPNNPNNIETKSTLVPISNKAIRLDEVLTQRGVTIDHNVLTKINLLRNGTSKSFLFSSLLLDPSKEIYLENGDRVIVEYLPYKQDKVFILGAGISPTKFDISPSNRETMADALFTENGALSSVDANRSEVYLLRGNGPVVAYHLNALNTARLIVAEAMELRPNDILFVAEQPISSFNRALERIFPLRSLIGNITSN